MPLRLYNTLTKRLEDFRPRDASHISFYTCGPTVYDDAHIGNFRSFLAADVLRRWIESPLCELQTATGGIHKGPRQVVHVMNITDVGHMTDDAEGGEHGEDRMAVAGRRLQEAKKAGKLPAGAAVDPSNPYQIAEFYAGRFIEDALALGLKLAHDAKADPTLMPRATANVPGMIEVIARLIKSGHAYAVGPAGNQTVYFSVQTFEPYGRLSGNTLDNLRTGAGGRINDDNQAQKKHPADFLLWKSDPSHVMKWDSPWGKGYPGWHIECSVMSLRGLRGTDTSMSTFQLPNGQPLIDIHSGGEDNIFPHHECELAQSCCAFNADPQAGSFASLWFHPRFLLVEGTKMSKSKGNFFTARDLFAKGIEPAALRLELIKTHYRANANFTEQGLKDSQRTIERWRRFLGDTPLSVTAGAVQSTWTKPAQAAADAFAAAMSDDLNIAGAIAEVNKWTAQSDRATPADVAFFSVIDAVLGVLALEAPKASTNELGIFLDGLTPDPAITAKLEERRTARVAKDFKRSDVIRDELLAMGYAIKDVAGGKVEVRRA